MQAAQAGRADVWILGDSISAGLDTGFNHAAASRWGIAGGGVGSDYGGAITLAAGGVTYGYTPPYPLNSNGWDTAPSAVLGNRTGYALPFGEPATAGAAAAQNYSAYVFTQGYMDPAAAYDWHFWVSAGAGGGSLSANRRADALNVTQQAPAVSTVTPANGLQQVTFHFDPIAGASSGSDTLYVPAATNTSILYSRLTLTGAKGVTVTTWSYGGHDTLQMIDDKFAAMTQAGRAQFLTAMTDGGSGKLLVPINLSGNDHGDASPSIRGAGPSNTEAGYVDNLTYLMDEIRSDWAAAGKSASDLSFLLLGAYEKDVTDVSGNEFLRMEAGAMSQVAVAHPADTSFVDMYDIMGPEPAAMANGYLVDGVHPSVSGSYLLGDGIVSQLVPEPGALYSAVGLAGWVLLARRTKRSRAAA